MQKSLSDYRVDFLDYLSDARGYSDLTVKSYDESLKEAFLYVHFEQVDEKYLLNLMPYRLKISELNPKTISKKLSAIRSFCAYLQERGFAVFLKADDAIRVPKTLPKPIAHKYILEALEKASLEERVAVVMLYTLGLRISELTSLKVSDIGSEWVRVLGKGNKTRDVPLLKSTRELLDIYIASKPAGRLLFEHNGEKLSENSLRYVVTKLFKRIGLKVTPHQLRHSFATELLNNNAKIADVSELLGHSSMATTQIYTKLGSILKRENYKEAHPLCKDE